MSSDPSLAQGHGYSSTTCLLTSASSSAVSAFCIAALHSASSSSELIGAAVHHSIASSTTSSTSSPTSCNCSSRAASSFSTALSGQWSCRDNSSSQNLGMVPAIFDSFHRQVVPSSMCSRFNSVSQNILVWLIYQCPSPI